MKRKKARGARALFLLIVATVFGVAAVVFPLKKSHSAGPADAGAPAAAAPAKGAKKGAKPVAAEQADAGAPAEAAAAAAPAPATPGPAASEDPTSIPIGKGLPVQVNIAAFFLEVNAFDDTKGDLECTTDMRLRWVDPRLTFTPAEGSRGYRELLGKAAEEALAKMWSPSIDVKNRVEGSSASYVGRRLRIFPNGGVESITRVSAHYKVPVDPSSFPFDRQRLALEFIVRDATTDEIVLHFDKEDVGFSRASREAHLDGWNLGLVDLSAGTIAGWNGDRYSTASGTLIIDRDPTSSLAAVFIPLLASLLIPLLALWMNKSSEEGFEVDAFELANMGIGGLFSVIALSFAIYSSNPIIAGGDNTVTRLFGLNYAMLALSLAIVVIFFRYELPARWFGHHVQHQAFKFIAWATPVLSLATAIAFLLVAAA